MRNLGLLRTLMLLDGQRAVGSDRRTGQVDIDNFPEQLIKNVEVVTGRRFRGVRLDAVAGVVNFVLDREFTGVKGEVSGGMTGLRRRRRTTRFRWRVVFRLRVVAATLSTQRRDARQQRVNAGTRTSVGTRRTHNYIANPAYDGTERSAGVPLLRDDVFLSAATHWRLDHIGSAQGHRLRRGRHALSVQLRCRSRARLLHGGRRLSCRRALTMLNSLLPSQRRENLFSRVSFDITDNLNVFAQFSRGTNSTFGLAFPHYQAGTGPPCCREIHSFRRSVQARMTALGLPNIRLGTMNYDMPFVNTQTDRSREPASRRRCGRQVRHVGQELGRGTATSRSARRHGEQAYRQRAVDNAHYHAGTGCEFSIRPTGTIVCRSTLTNPE